MRVNGRRIFLDNHTMENLEKMYAWENDEELKEIENGKIGRYENINDFKCGAMASYIENNHESNSPFCHFAIHRMHNGELIGYVDFQDINEGRAELSLSILDKNYRNKH